jgi:hypothetical protein
MQGGQFTKAVNHDVVNNADGTGQVIPDGTSTVFQNQITDSKMVPHLYVKTKNSTQSIH